MLAYISLLNAGDVEGILALFDDNVTITSTRGQLFQGEAQARVFVTAIVRARLQSRPRGLQVSGDRVSYSTRRSDDELAKIGVGEVEQASEYVVRDGKIQSLGFYFPPNSVAIIEAACQKPEAAGVRLFGQTCDDFVRLARAHTQAMLQRSSGGN